MGDARTTESQESMATPEELRVRYCCGCGKPLPLGKRWHFHPDCLRADKRWRMSEKRNREKERLQQYLKNQKCWNCGKVVFPKPMI
jgi:NMD protein affecting ribosome stability and mRNA decay